MRKPFAAEELVRKIDSFLAPGGPTPLLPAVTGAAARLDESGPSLASLAGLATRPDDPVLDTGAVLSSQDLRTSLGQLTAIPGVVVAALVDREGFLVESAGAVPEEAELTWALAAAAAQSASAIGQELNQGLFQAMILESEGGVVLLHAVGPRTMLAVVLADPTALGKVRYSIKRALPDLLRCL
jgi:predicted regulator of Ras-like GTPase activity (Roadblock/LC7/MglB family)